jgi:hypothetical protein
MVTTTPPIRGTGLAMSLKNELNQEDANMGNVLEITATFEPMSEIETRFRLTDGDFRSFAIEGYQGSIIIQSECDEFNNHLVFRIRKQLNPADVLRKEIKILKQMQEDIGNMIDQLKQRVNS